MENELTVFQGHRQRVQLAVQEWLLRWQLPPWPGIVCPQCQARSFSKVAHPKGGNTHICKQCGHRFSLNDLPGCHCTFPGGLTKCATCKHYLDLVRYVEQRLPELRRLSDEEVTRQFNPRKYAQRDMTRSSGVAKSRDQQESPFPDSIDHPWIQLSVLDTDAEA
jgi:hypothetical protein